MVKQNSSYWKKSRFNKEGVYTLELSEPGKYRVELAGEGVGVVVSGVFVGKKKQKIEVEIEIVHLAPRTQATTVLKGAGFDQSLIRFKGKIVVAKNCPNVNSFLREKILLVSQEARAEAIPDLEIESDDVKCSHAAIVTKVPELELFYLESRGINETKAKKLIVEGFLAQE